MKTVEQSKEWRVKVEKYTLQELSDLDNWKRAVIVFKQESFTKEYSERERSYEINSDARYFDPNAISSSLFGNCLDGTEQGVRLDSYMAMDEGWAVDYCYITE